MGIYKFLNSLVKKKKKKKRKIIGKKSKPMNYGTISHFGPKSQRKANAGKVYSYTTRTWG